jgi:hypothetical protein
LLLLAVDGEIMLVIEKGETDMSWKIWLEEDTDPKQDQWNELLGKSPWDFVVVPNWRNADMGEPWDFSDQYGELSSDEAECPAPPLAEGVPEQGTWEINPLTGIKVWIANR